MQPNSAPILEMDSIVHARFANPAPPKSPAVDLREKMLQITASLQTSLELVRLIGLFSEHVQGLVPHEGMEYSHASCGTNAILVGENGVFHAEIALNVGEESVGTLGIARNCPITPAEANTVRHLSATLLFPLRNALMYKAAREGAIRDPLTGLHNRLALDETAAREIDRARRYGAPLSLVCVDIDNFKLINDTWGHSAGDAVIKHLADIMRQTARGSDMTFRIGGEEFVILAANTTLEGAVQLGERLRVAFANQPCTWHDHRINVALSAGVAECRIEWDLLTLFEHADRGLYVAKRSGRNQVCVYGGTAT